MEIISTEISGVLLLQPKVSSDQRGYFMETYNKRTIGSAGFAHEFVQDNHSHSRKGVLRGLHYQIRHQQGKLVRVAAGEIFDVAVDLRRNSPSFGKWLGRHLSGENRLMLWIPPGFAHGFAVLSETADVLYKATEYYAPEYERTILWNDPDLSILWPISGDPVMSEKDLAGKRLKDAEFEL